MGGSSLSGMFGGPSTLGSNANAPANTTPAVMGAMGQLEAFDPTTMAGTYNTPTTPTMENLTSSGTTAGSGLPSYVTNFLQQGGTGTLAPPQYTMDPGAGLEQAGVAAAPIAAAAKKIGTGKQTGSGGYGGANKTAAAPTAPGAAGATAPQYTAIPFNAPGGYNQVGLQQPQMVSDQYNPMQGNSNQIAWSKGGAAAPQMMAGSQILMDGKGGFFMKDAKTGKPVPLTGVGLTAAQGIARSMGYS